MAAAFVARYPGPDRTPTILPTVALMLYGQHDPDRVEVAGLHGLGGRRTRITLTQAGPCRVTVTAEPQSETIDFRRVSSIRYAEMVDPAAGLIGLTPGVGPPSASARRLVVAVLDGEDDAVCAGSGCVAKRVFALGDPENLAEARVAAGVFLSRVCPRGHQE